MRAVVSAVCVLLLNCSEESRGPSSARSIREPEVSALASVRRPAEHHVMVRTGERCVISILRPSPAEDERVAEVACPLELELGESIRATGMTCMRESSIKARNVPIVCPSSLSVAVREFRKRQASASP